VICHGQGGCGLRRLPPWKSPPIKACRSAQKTPRPVDLFTEIRRARQLCAALALCADLPCNYMFLNNVILFKYCAEIKMPLSDGHLDGFDEAYSQSYPQNLWVSNLLFGSNKLIDYAKVSSSIGRQASESA
jgi:hypothetical protein